MRLLHVWSDHVRNCDGRRAVGSERRRTRSDERKSVPLRRVSRYRCRHSGCPRSGEIRAMMPFELMSATDLTSAVQNGAAAGTRFVAGGTTLIDLMKLHVERPSHVIDLTPLVRHDASLGA